MTSAEADKGVQSGIAALRRGDAAEACRLLREVTAGGEAGPGPWFLLAQACRQADDEAGEAEALDRVLAAQPRHVGALVMRGDLYFRSGDRRSAGAFYRSAVKTAAAAPRLPPMLEQEVRRAEAAAAGIEAEFASHLQARLQASGAAGLPRVAEAIGIMQGRARVFLQEPTSFYFPGLPQIAFYGREGFEWLAGLEASTDAIREELAAAMAEETGFRPYVEADPDRPPALDPMLGDPSWSAFHLFSKGEPHPENAPRCPRTMAALQAAPLPRIAGRSPMALFSMLRPGATIAPHNGLLNTRLICHLPLVVPPDCALRVGNEVRRWEMGQALIFDDSIEHEAWNRSNQTRVILLFEVWRPEISTDERTALTALFEAIGDYGGGADAL
jgi:aspartyl/asparaginyl beta-hydroxylase (cupin superfamily)